MNFLIARSAIWDLSVCSFEQQVVSSMTAPQSAAQLGLSKVTPWFGRNHSIERWVEEVEKVNLLGFADLLTVYTVDQTFAHCEQALQKVVAKLVGANERIYIWIDRARINVCIPYCCFLQESTYWLVDKSNCKGLSMWRVVSPKKENEGKEKEPTGDSPSKATTHITEHRTNQRLEKKPRDLVLTSMFNNWKPILSLLENIATPAPAYETRTSSKPPKAYETRTLSLDCTTPSVNWSYAVWYESPCSYTGLKFIASVGWTVREA